MNYDTITHNEVHMKMMVYILFFFAFVNSAFAANGMFMVVKGDVKLSAGGNKAPTVAKVGTQVNQGDQIITGADSRAKIVMSDRNIINVSPNTKLVIEQYVSDEKSKNVKLSLLEGKIRTNVEQKYDNDKNKFEIRTPTAVAGVRGTQFITSYSEASKKTEVITLQGQVEFRNVVAGNSNAKEETVVVQKGEQSSVGSGGAAPEPPKKVPPEIMKDVERDTNIKNKEMPSTQGQPPPPPLPPPTSARPNPADNKPPLIDGAIGNKFDKTKVKVVPKPPGS
jgi:hypothetical protein